MCSMGLVPEIKLMYVSLCMYVCMMLMAMNQKTANIIKRGYYSASHCLLAHVTVSDQTINPSTNQCFIKWPKWHSHSQAFCLL